METAAPPVTTGVSSRASRFVCERDGRLHKASDFEVADWRAARHSPRHDALDAGDRGSLSLQRRCFARCRRRWRDAEGIGKTVRIASDTEMDSQQSLANAGASALPR